MFNSYNYRGNQSTAIADDGSLRVGTNGSTINPGPSGSLPQTIGRYEGELEGGRNTQSTEFHSAAYTPIVSQPIS